MAEITGSGFGKVILFGEHFVVHGCPAIVAAIFRRTRVRVEEHDGDDIPIDSAIDPAYMDRSRQAVRVILSELKEHGGVSLRVDSDIPIGEGLGSSAAFCVAASRALAKFFYRDLDQRQLIGIATRAECVFHEKSSGLDTTASAVGGIISFQPAKGDIEELFCRKRLEIIIAGTGKPGNTGEMVRLVDHLKLTDSKVFSSLLSKEHELVADARAALEKSDLVGIGKLMNQNHDLLRDLGVSTRDLELYTKVARRAGALGAKLTGAGGGGSIVALVDSETKKAVSGALADIGANVYSTDIG